MSMAIICYLCYYNNVLMVVQTMNIVIIRGFIMYRIYSESGYEAYIEELQEQLEELTTWEEDEARLDYEDSEYEMRKELGWL